MFELTQSLGEVQRRVGDREWGLVVGGVVVSQPWGQTYAVLPHKFPTDESALVLL